MTLPILAGFRGKELYDEISSIGQSQYRNPWIGLLERGERRELCLVENWQTDE